MSPLFLILLKNINNKYYNCTLYSEYYISGRRITHISIVKNKSGDMTKKL